MTQNKINIAEILKDCPKGLELYSPIFGKLYLDKIRPHLSIVVTTDKEHGDFKEEFLYDGRYSMNGECMLFPSKGDTTWEKFIPPCKFKDGDILATDLGSVFFLNTRLNTNGYYGCYVGIDGDSSFHIYEPFAYKECCGLATEEEKQKLFQAIESNGYKWNEKTKTLEKLIKPVFKPGDKISLECEDLYWDIKTIEGDWYICTDGAKIHIGEQHHYELVSVKPKFKVGDKVRGKYTNNIYTISRITSTGYELTNGQSFTFNAEDCHELVVPNKFDINTLKTFDKVLVRGDVGQKWIIDFFGFMDNKKGYPFVCVGHYVTQCIPYEGNEHLLGTSDECDDFYKNWK